MVSGNTEILAREIANYLFVDNAIALAPRFRCRYAWYANRRGWELSDIHVPRYRGHDTIIYLCMVRSIGDMGQGIRLPQGNIGGPGVSHLHCHYLAAAIFLISKGIASVVLSTLGADGGDIGIDVADGVFELTGNNALQLCLIHRIGGRHVGGCAGGRPRPLHHAALLQVEGRG